MSQFTTVNVNNGSDTFRVPGILTPQQVVNTYSGSINGLASMASSVTDNENGDRVINFTQRVGTKG